MIKGMEAIVREHRFFAGLERTLIKLIADAPTMFKSTLASISSTRTIRQTSSI